MKRLLLSLYAFWLATGLVVGADGDQQGDESPLKYRLSYRKTASMPWTFYADIRDVEKAKRIQGSLTRIGYESQLVPVTEGSPPPTPPPPPPTPAPLPESFTNPPPMRSAMDFTGRDYFAAPHVVADSARPGYRSSPMALGNSAIMGRGGLWLGWGWGLGLNNNPMTRPQLNSMGPAQPSFRRNIPRHPTAGP